MAEYFGSVITVSALASLAALVSYGGDKDKWHKFAVLVILLYVSVTPVAALVTEFTEDDFFLDIDSDVGELGENAYGKVGEEAFKLGIRKAIAEKWDIYETDVLVNVSGFDFENMRAEKINVTLLGGGMGVDYRAVQEYIQKNGLGSCEVQYGFK